MATRAPPALMDELVEEILLRIPPDDPARLMRASIACKRWCRLVCGPGFRRRFRERHRRPPFLGFIRDCDDDESARFVPTCSSSFRPRRAVRRGWCAVDCRHGRVLLRREPRPRNHAGSVFAVWDPVTDVQRELPALPTQALYMYGGNAAVLCADRGGGCDHLDCHDGPYLVVFVGTHDVGTFASMYSSEAEAWGEPTSMQHLGCVSDNLRGAHVGNALYFVFFWETIINYVFTTEKSRILEYDLVSGEMTLIVPPPMDSDLIVLTTLESGGLGCVAEKGSGLYYLWSREAGPDGDMRWVQGKLIEYKIPDGHRMVILDVFGSADGGGVIYAATDHGAFTTDLKSGESMKLGGVDGFQFVVPFMSFYTPGASLTSLLISQ